MKDSSDKTALRKVPRRPLKIAMIGQKGFPATWGGIERHVEAIATRLVERGHEVSVFSRFHYTEHSGVHKGVRNYRYPSLNTKHLDTITACALASLKTIFSRFDVVHFHALGPSVFSWIPKLRKSKTVVTIHGLDWQRGKWGRFAQFFLRKCEATSVHGPDRTIVVSKTLKKYFKEKHNAETTFIPNGTDPGERRPPNRIKKWDLDKHKYALFVGRLVPEKGCHYLIEAFRRLDTDARLVMAGGSSFSDGYVDSLERLRQGDPRIQMVGYVYGEVLEELWTNAHFIVQPSILEGQSISLIEALSYGKCVLVSDIPENMEVVEDCAVSFNTRDVEDLHEKMKMLLGDPRLVDRVARRCGHLAEDQFSWPKIVEATERVYYEITGVPGPAAERDAAGEDGPQGFEVIPGGKASRSRG